MGVKDINENNVEEFIKRIIGTYFEKNMWVDAVLWEKVFEILQKKYGIKIFDDLEEFEVEDGNKTEIEVIKLIIAERKKTHSTIDAIDIISRLKEIANNYGAIMECLKEEGIIREE